MKAVHAKRIATSLLIAVLLALGGMPALALAETIDEVASIGQSSEAAIEQVSATEKDIEGVDAEEAVEEDGGNAEEKKESKEAASAESDEDAITTNQVSAMSSQEDVDSEEQGLTLATQAATHTQSEAVAWIKARADEGWWEDVDGVYGCQCVDLIHKYYQWYGYGRLSGNACDYKSGHLPSGSGWYYSSTPIPGAAFVKAADSTWQYGHIGLVYAVDSSKIYTVETNVASPYDGGKWYAKAQYRSHPRSGYACTYICPDFDTTPTIPDHERIPDGLYILRSKIGNRVLDISNGSYDNKANAQIYQPLGNAAQIFNIGWNAGLGANYIQLKGSGKFLDAAGGDGQVNVWQWEGNGTKGQHWCFVPAGDGWYYICNLFGYYLDVRGGVDANGTNVQTYTFNAADAQKWKPVRVSGTTRTVIESGSYVLRSKIGDRVLDIDGAKTTNKANAQIYQPNGSAAQIFNIGWNADLSANYIQLKASGKFLDAAGGDGEVNVWQYEGNGTKAQNWFFEDAGSGWFYVRNLFGYYLDVRGGVDANGTNVQTYTFNAADAQKWKPVRVSGTTRTVIESGSYVLRSKIGDRVLDIDGAKTTNKANAQIYQPNGSAAQIFNIGWNADLSANYIQLKASGKFLDAAGGDGEVNVWQYEGNGTKAQNWFFEDAGSGWFYIRNLFGYYLDVRGGVDANGTNVQTYTFNAADAQKWKPVTWTAPKDISSASVSVAGQTYTGNALKPRPVVTLDGTTIVEGTDYEVAWSDNTNAGTGYVILTGKGSYTGTKMASFQIAKATQAVTVTKSSLSLAPNKSENIVAESTGDGKLTYTSSNTKVATVTSSGVVKAISAGNASITVSAASTDNYEVGTATVSVTVTQSAQESGATRSAQKIAASNKTVGVNKKVELDAATNGDGKLTYKSSDVSISTVDADGVVTGVKPGQTTVTITAAATGKYKKASKTVTITVKGTNTLVAKRKKARVTVSLTKLKSKYVRLASNVIVRKAKGKVSYANVSSNAMAKKFKVNSKSGKVTVPKGTKKGTYAIKVKVVAKGTKLYYEGWKTVTYKVVVK